MSSKAVLEPTPRRSVFNTQPSYSLTDDLRFPSSVPPTNISAAIGSPSVGIEIAGGTTEITKKKANLVFEPKTAFGLNRWIILALAVYICIVCGVHLFSWTAWEGILKHERVFSDLCANEIDPLSVCEAQENKIASLLSLSTMTMYSLTFCAGFFLDLAGPRVCALIGGILLVIGWILLLMYKLGNAYVLGGFALLGAGIDPCFFGILCVANLFPGHEAAVIACLGGSRSLTAVFPVVMQPFAEAGHLNLTGICIIFLVMEGIAVALFFVVAPMNPYRHIVDQSTPLDIAVKQEEALSVGYSKGFSHEWSKLPLADYSKLTNQALAYTGAATDVVVKNSPTVRRFHGVGTAVSEYAVQKWKRLVEQLKECAKLMPKPLYWLVGIISIVNMIRNNWFLASASKQLSGGATNCLSYLMTVSFLVGPIMGIAVDLWGAIVAMLFLAVTNLISIIFLMMTQISKSGASYEAMGYLAAVFGLPGFGFFSSQIYCYMATVFPPENMGKLVGFVFFVSGMSALCVAPMFTWSQTHQFWSIDLAMIIATVITVFIILSLFPLQKKEEKKRLEESKKKQALSPWEIFDADDEEQIRRSRDYNSSNHNSHDGGCDDDLHSKRHANVLETLPETEAVVASADYKGP